MVVLLRDARFTRYDVKDESSGRRRYIVYASPLSSSPLSSVSSLALSYHGSGSCTFPSLLRCRYASVPYPSMLMTCRSPPKYLA